MAKAKKKKKPVKKAAKKRSSLAKKKKAPTRKKKTAAKSSKKKISKPMGPTPPGAVISSSTAYRPPKNEKELGEVEDFFAQVSVIAMHLKDSLKVGDTLHVRGHTTDITQRVDSMQVDHQAIEAAKKGDSVGIKVKDRCRKGDRVFRVD